jgi:sn1-specific diacylglycerol lipase
MSGGGGSSSEGVAESWSSPGVPVVVGDTCSGCHLAALKQSIGVDGDYQVIFASFHVDVAETPFFVAVDYRHQAVVVSIRGTISMKDVITDLHAEAEPIPLQLPRDDWFGHKVNNKNRCRRFFFLNPNDSQSTNCLLIF